MTDSNDNIVAFPLQKQPEGTYLTDDQMFWEWKKKAADYLNDCSARGIEPHDEVKEGIHEVNGYLVELGYSPIIVDF